MSEGDWLNATDPQAMLSFLRDGGRVSDRKLRLFAVACCRRLRHLLVPEVCKALEVAEKVAEGVADPAERRRVREMAFHAGWLSDPSTAHRRVPAKAAVCDALARRAWEAAARAVWRAGHVGTLGTWRGDGEDWGAAKRKQDTLLAGLLRCVVGNPFRAKPAIDPAWLVRNDGVVQRLAEGIYNERAFEKMPVLADALADAGCDDEDLMRHCREPGLVHCRGCWAVDLILGKV